MWTVPYRTETFVIFTNKFPEFPRFKEDEKILPDYSHYTFFTQVTNQVLNRLVHLRVKCTKNLVSFTEGQTTSLPYIKKETSHYEISGTPWISSVFKDTLRRQICPHPHPNPPYIIVEFGIISHQLSPRVFLIHLPVRTPVHHFFFRPPTTEVLD